VRILLSEIKTSGEDITPGSPYWTRLLMDVQVSLYIEAARSLGIEAEGVLYDVLYKPKLRPLLATPEADRKYTKAKAGEPSRLYANQRDRDETPEEYGERVLKSIAESPDSHYQRRTIVRLERERLEAQADTWQTAGAIRDARRLRVWPRNPDSCMQWSRKCDYFDVCAGISTIDDPFLFERIGRTHEELDSDTPRDREALVLLTQSSIRCYRACPRRYFYRYEERIRSLAKQDDKLRRGTSLHRALETWNKTDGNLALAIDQLDRLHPKTKEPIPYSFELERAMMTGYAVRWGPPIGTVYVEKEFRTALTNPETGASSRTFELGGKIDKIIRMEEV
jgi:hypothetical protein